MHGIPVIRAYNQVGERLLRFRDALDACRAANLQLVHRLAPLLHTVKATIEAGFAVVLLAAIYLFLGGQVQTLTVIAFLVLALRIYQPIVAIVAQAELLRIADGSMERVAAVLDTEPQAQPTSNTCAARTATTSRSTTSNSPTTPAPRRRTRCCTTSPCGYPSGR